MKYYRNKDCRSILQIGVVISEIYPNKIESCKTSEKVVRGTTYVEVWAYTTVAYLPVLKNWKGLKLLGDLQSLHIFL